MVTTRCFQSSGGKQPNTEGDVRSLRVDGYRPPTARPRHVAAGPDEYTARTGFPILRYLASLSPLRRTPVGNGTSGTVRSELSASKQDLVGDCSRKRLRTCRGRWPPTWAGTSALGE